MTRLDRTRELYWLAPIVGIALLALGLLRPMPHLNPPAHGRTVVDAAGAPVEIEWPYRGTALLGGYFYLTGWYLDSTRAPESLMYAGTAANRKEFTKGLMYWIYPEVERKQGLWGSTAFKRSHGSDVDIESALAYAPGAYLTTGSRFTSLPLLRSVGLPVLSYWEPKKIFADVCIDAVRVENRLIGTPERGEVIIARYYEARAELEREYWDEMRPSTLGVRPRTALMASFRVDATRGYRGGMTRPAIYHDQIAFPSQGMTDATVGWKGGRDDVERILAMDPDIILLQGGDSPEQVMQDPRWAGLKAVRQKRVYRLPGFSNWGSALVVTPVVVRWIDEITHPDRLQPRVRQMLYDRLLAEYGYKLSEEQIDKFLKLDENRNSAGYWRFTDEYKAAMQERSGE
ncbi:MAG: ABC transporter substrate-binding protein [Acidobacteriota bacterium]|nr:ABC transporter substrate-binding protein [Acidobacteriota bacterium]